MTSYQCIKCQGTGVNKRGGPCGDCRNTGAVDGLVHGTQMAGLVARLIVMLPFVIVLVWICINIITH